MKTSQPNTILRSAVFLSAVAIGLFASITNAQTRISRASIPFTFKAGSQQMPAGLYDISFKSGRLVVLLQDRDPGKFVSAYVKAIPAQGDEFRENGRLMFSRYGDQYFLREVWQRGSADGATCAISAEERAILRLKGPHAVTGTQVTIASEPKR